MRREGRAEHPGEGAALGAGSRRALPAGRAAEDGALRPAPCSPAADPECGAAVPRVRARPRPAGVGGRWERGAPLLALA